MAASIRREVVSDTGANDSSTNNNDVCCFHEFFEQGDLAF
jgi:hypothetical protein